MRKLLIWLITVLCPGIIFLITGEYIKMVFAFALEASVVGWIPAMIWASRAWKQHEKRKQAPPSKPKTTVNKKKATPATKTKPTLDTPT